MSPPPVSSRRGLIFRLYCSQPCATFGPYIFTTKVKSRRGGHACGRGRLSARFPSRTPPRASRHDDCSLVAGKAFSESGHTRSAFIRAVLISFEGDEKRCHRTLPATRATAQSATREQAARARAASARRGRAARARRSAVLRRASRLRAAERPLARRRPPTRVSRRRRRGTER